MTRQFLIVWLAVKLGLAIFVGIIEFVELSRRLSDETDQVAGLALQMSLLKLSSTIELIFPFAVLFAGMFTFWRMTRSRELIVARAAGLSAWQFIAPILIAAVTIGVLKVAVYDPLGSALQERYVAMEDRYIVGNLDGQRLQILSEGLWLRQEAAGGASLMVARGMGQDTSHLRDVIVFRYGPGGDYLDRIDAPEAILRDGEWVIAEGRVTEPGGQPSPARRVTIPTPIDPESIEDSFARPGTLSVWELPGFIDTLEASGFSAVRHRLHLQGLMAQPLMMAAMVLFAAAFTLRTNQRRGSGLTMTVAGIATALGIFVLSDIVTALGLAQSIPIILAAWAPAGIGVLISLGLLLHLEDG
jgi:lipopolysaccharide export system permease protein